jgi:adenylosuccinate synthase
MWGLALTKLDVLTGIDPLRVCVAYQLGAKRYEEMPPGRGTLERARPIYEEMPGWRESLSGARALSDLPPDARRYLERIAALAGVRLAMVGVGAPREATIVLSNPFLA